MQRKEKKAKLHPPHPRHRSWKRKLVDFLDSEDDPDFGPEGWWPRGMSANCRIVEALAEAIDDRELY